MSVINIKKLITQTFNGDGQTTSFNLKHIPLYMTEVTVDGEVLVEGTDYEIGNEKTTLELIDIVPTADKENNVVVSYYVYDRVPVIGSVTNLKNGGPAGSLVQVLESDMDYKKSKVTGDARFSLSTGRYNKVSGYSATALCYNNIVTGNYAFAANGGNNVGGNSSAAFGSRNTIVEGTETNFATGLLNKIIGSQNFVSGIENTAELNSIANIIGGTGNSIYAENTIVGGNTNISGSETSKSKNTIISGTSNTVSSVDTIVSGNNNTATDTGNIVSGNNNTVNSTNTIISGATNKVLPVSDGAKSSHNIVSGSGNTVTGSGNTVVSFTGTNNGSWNALLGGQNNTIKTSNSAVIGGRNNSNEALSAVIAGGSGNKITTPNANTDSGALVAGTGNTVSNFAGFAAGKNNTVSGDSGFAAGTGNTVSSTNSGVFGNGNTVKGNNSFATGNVNTVNGVGSIATGYSGTATGACVSLLGGQRNSVATNNTAIIGGTDNKIEAGGINSVIAGGTGNTIKHSNGNSLTNSLATGANNTIENCENCFVTGQNNKVIGDNQTVVGKFNASATTYLFAVGNGTSDSDRKNAFTVNTDGTGTIGGKIIATKDDIVAAIGAAISASY